MRVNELRRELADLAEAVPAAGQDPLGAITYRVSRRRRGKRVVISMAVLALTGAAVSLAFTYASQDTRQRVIAGAGATTSIAVKPGTLVRVEIRVDATTVAAGQDVTGTVIFHNLTDHYVNLPPDRCLSKWIVRVTSARHDPFVGVLWTLECAGGGDPYGKVRGAYLSIPAGTTEVPFRAPTLLLMCDSGSPALRCPPNGNFPPLPPGPAKVWFLTQDHVEQLDSPAPIDITISP